MPQAQQQICTQVKPDLLWKQQSLKERQGKQLRTGLLQLRLGTQMRPLVSWKMRKAVAPLRMGRPGTSQYTEVLRCQKTAGKTEIQGYNSLPLVLLPQQGTIKLQGTASRWLRPFPGLEQGARGQTGQGKPRLENEDLLRHLSQIWLPSVPQKYKLFYPVCVAFRNVLAWGSKVRKSKWQLELDFFSANTLKCISCVSRRHHVSCSNKPLRDKATTSWCFCKGKQTKNHHQQKKTIHKPHVNCKSKSSLVKFCFKLHYRKFM